MDSKSIGQCCICGGLTEKAWDKCGNEMKFLICSRAECRWRAWSMVRRAAGKKATEYVFDGELAYSKSGRRTQQDVLREHYDDIKKEYAHGMTRHEIAKKYSVSLNAVNTFFRKHDIYVERRGRKTVLSYIKKFGMLKNLHIINTNHVAKAFWESIFELEEIERNPIDTYYEIKGLKASVKGGAKP